MVAVPVPDAFWVEGALSGSSPRGRITLRDCGGSVAYDPDRGPVMRSQVRQRCAR